MKDLPFLRLVILCSMPGCLVYAQNNAIECQNKKIVCPCIECCSPVREKSLRENDIPLPYIAIAYYKPNYFLPVYYTGSPDNRAYIYATPGRESLKKIEAKYQISLKVPVWKCILGYHSSFYFGFTLQTYWQIYNHYSFIRTNDYEPDFFISNPVSRRILGNWYFDYINYGYVHQSNGWGNYMERRWDRGYVDAITSVDNWMISLKSWFLIHSGGSNPDIGSYLGYARLLITYKLQQQVFSFELTNIGAQVNRSTTMLTWSFPITPYIKGYAQVFSGYGQSLIEYNHRTNSAGVGFALSDWL